MGETFRISIPITVEDNTDPGVSQATRKINGFDRANQKTQERLNQMNRTKYQVVLDALDRASGIIGKVSSKARSIAGKTFSFTMKVIDMATAPLSGIWNFATSIQGAILGATGAFAGIYKPMDIAGDYEQTQIAFETMLKSAEKAEQFLKDASEFANKTPFEFPELINSSKLLLAFGFEADKILDLMTVIGDTSSGLGAGAEGIDRITRALGQMQAKGRAQAEELLQLQELGVPANQILQEELGLTGEQIGNIGKESIEAAKVIDALLRGMDKRFGGMMDNQSKTAKGMMSTLKDTLQNSLLRPWGQGLWEGVKPGLEKITTWIDENQETIAAWGEAWKKAGANISKLVTSKVEGLQDSIRRMTNSQEWKDAKTFGAKMKIAWDQIIAQPFNEWWNSTGKVWIADKASKIGTGIGSAITFGILALLGVDVKGAAADGASIGASFAEGFKVGFDGRKVGEGILSAIKGVFKDAGTLFPGGKEASSTSWISAGLLTLMGIKGSKAIGTIFKGGKGIYNYGKGLLKGSNAADAAIHATKAVGAATGPLDNAADIAKSTAHLKDAAGSFRTAANASKEAEKAVKTAEVLKAAKQADLEKSARLLKELKKEAAKFGDDIPKGLLGKIKAADKAVTKGRVDVKKAASHLDDMVNMKSFKALEYANAREGFAIARDVANAAKATNQVGGAASSTGIFSKITGWLGKNSDNALIAGSQAAGKGIKGIPVLGTLLGLTASGAVVASAAPENRGRAVAGEAGSWLGAIGAGAGAGALVGTVGGGPIGTVAGSIAGGIGGAIGGEAFAEWLYDQKDAIGGFFSNTLPSLAGSAWDALKMGASDAGSWIADKWSGFSDWFGTSVWKPVKDVGISAINIAAGAWSGARDAISDKWGDFSNWFDENAWEPVSNTAQAAG
ncbi:MAG: tape measure protein, partial [Eubacteriales bacterium]|nr:tape measure protein [Eubacteriales bacterium]